MSFDGLPPLRRVVDAAAAFYAPEAFAAEIDKARGFAAIDHRHALARAARIEWRRKTEHVAQREVLDDAASDAKVKHWARRRACEAQALAGREADPMDAYAALRTYVNRWRVGDATIEAPDLRERDGVPQYGPWIARVTCRIWWTRCARRMLGRGIEGMALDAGRVHRRAGRYVSDRNAERCKLAARRNAQMMLDMEAENELGQRVRLAEMAKGSVANPWVRFAEMMVTLKGLESIADAGRWRGLFLTWTLPSRYHARLSESGEKNPAYDPKLRPREGQGRFRELWARARALLAKWKAQAFGLRVAEPHHDGTPHWHLLVWVRPKFVRRVLGMLRGLALEEAPDEPGAAAHRFKVERIRRREGDKGGAASYLAKYVAKMTTGGQGTALERGADGVRRDMGAPSEAAHRARWWASVHGIRQFQFFGIPPRGIWREARRIRAPLTVAEIPQAEPSQLELLETVRATADRSDYAGHVLALGGVALPRSEYAVQVLKRDDGEVGRYGEPMGAKTIGLHVPGRVFAMHRPRYVARRRKFGFRVMRQTLGAQAEAVTVEGAARVVTRLHVWVLKPARSVTGKGADSAPWTRGNNCNGVARAAPDSPARGVDPIEKPDPWDVWVPPGGTIGGVAT